MTGKFIVIEGLEGAGKSTAISTVQAFLNEKNFHDLLITREPGGTIVGEALRKLIKEPQPTEVLDKRAELLLLYAARTQLVEQVIRPALENGSWIIADRFELSSYAYQGGGRGINCELIDSLSHFCVGDLKPDLILFLDISPEIGLKRAEQRGKKDRIEAESQLFFQAVYNAYHVNLKKLSNIKIIDASQSLSTVQQAIRQQMDIFLRELDLHG